ncbi:MAG: hypothetical protein JW876_11105 [Candidatus Krumholzibacteriota bacterium]|nr:hypothetical protein [Candidatus Krumholzibacteriota bacterium]
MRPAPRETPTLEDFARRIEREEVRGLFATFCAEVEGFPGVVVETAPFDARFVAHNGFVVRVSPYADLFLAAVGAACPCEMRVATREGLAAALDLAMRHFLDTAGASPPPARVTV